VSPDGAQSEWRFAAELEVMPGNTGARKVKAVAAPRGERNQDGQLF
jgi:hypothetical protein